MKTIWKYEFNVSDRFSIPMPGTTARVLDVGIQGDQLCMWALVEPEGDLFTQTFRVYGTGHEIPDPDSVEHLGSVQQGPFVWHVFREVYPF